MISSVCTAFAATWTAGPLVHVEFEPPAFAAAGDVESPRSGRTRVTGMPSSSAARIANTVYWPVPRSAAVPDTDAVPSGCSLTLIDA